MAVLDQAQGQMVEEEVESGGEKVYVAPPWKLMWWKFRKHKMAVFSTVVLILFYFVAAFCEFVAPYDPDQALIQFKQAPPTAIHLRDAQGQFQWPFVYQHTRTLDPASQQIKYV